MTAITPRLSRAHGFTLVEVMAAASILLVGLLGTFTMVDRSQKTTRANSSRTAAVSLAREILEQARALEYQQVTPATLVAQLRARPGLAGEDDAQGRWTITRRGIVTAVVVSVCTFDDPMDGLAVLPPVDACPPPPPVRGAPVEANPDDFRRVTLDLEWRAGGVVQRAQHTTLIANPSGGRGPRIVSFPDPFALQVTAGVSVPFVVTTTFAASVRWAMDDGVNVGDAHGGPTLWGFNWDIGTVGLGKWTVDGTYTASVQPFDSRGVPGEMRVATVLLNRRVPLAPAGVTGGRSEAGGGVVELEWAQSKERDVLGYRVYRVGLTSKTRVCPAADAGAAAVSRRTACTDPAPNALGHYQVVAVDRPNLGDPTSGTREGDASTYVVPSLGLRPSPPAGLGASIVDGRVKLTWTPPAGVPVLFYRIYRDGVRIDRTVSLDPVYVDQDPFDNTPHRYAVTAVGATFNESEMSGEVVIG